MVRIKGNPSKYIEPPNKCKGCKRMLKSKDKYIMGDKVKLSKGLWTIEKKCRKCGYVNVKEDK